MKIKLNKKTFNYLHENILIEQPDLFDFVKSSEIGEKIIIELDEEIVCNIRDWACEKLQKIGFDKNYDLTPQGELLEEIIDLLYI